MTDGALIGAHVGERLAEQAHRDRRRDDQDEETLFHRSSLK
jgi:hypothetical protein